MRSFRRDAVAAGLLALASHTSAQVASYCPPNTEVCYRLNIPQSTASSGTGDIFFQLSAPSNYEWVALGQGSSMRDANIFVVYTSGNGNVTISPRAGVGEREPPFNQDARVTLLEGSGVSNGKMIANVRCSSCNSWSGATVNFSEDRGNWIWAFSSRGGPKDTTDQSAGIAQHNNQAAFQWDYARAKGGSSVNPLVNAAQSGTGTVSCVPRPVSTGGSNSAGTSAGASSAATSTASDDDDQQTQRGPWGSGHPTARPTGPPGYGNNKRQEQINYCEDSSNSGVTELASTQSRTSKMVVAHGAIAALVFVILFPFGAIAIRVASFTGLVWVHAAFQGFAYLLYIAAFGLGIYIANEKRLINETHPIIGIVVFACLFFQPIFGVLHHLLFKKHQSRTFWSYAHIWLGRLVITLGIINGGFGFRLAKDQNNRSAMIAYSVIAGVVWSVWVAASVFGERRRKTALANAPPKYTESPRQESTVTSDVPHPENGHYAPVKEGTTA